jgi:hypothetical protein
LRPSKIAQVFALCAGLSMGAGLGCRLGIDIDTGHLACTDGQCPGGFNCVEAVCVPAPPGPEPGTCNQMTLVADDFNGGAISSLWGFHYGFNGAATSEPGGHLRIDVPAGLDGAAYAGYTTDRYYDLTGSHVTVEIGTMVNVDGHAQMILQLYGTAAFNAENAGFEQQHGELKMFVRKDGVDDTLSVPYDGATMRFWQLREHDGELLFETSPDGDAWTIQRQVVPPFPLTLLRVDVSAGVYQNEPDPGFAEFVAVNGGQSAGDRCKVGQLSDDFDDGVVDGRWANSYGDPSCQAGEQDGAFAATVTDASVGPAYCAYRSAAAFDLTGSQLVLEVDQMIELAPASPGVAYVKLTASQNRHGVELVQEGGTLKCRRWENQQYSDVDSSPWDGTADRYWKIAEQDGQVSWSTSPDGDAWTRRCQTPTSEVNVKDVQVEIGVGVTFSAPGQTIGTFRADRLNP